MELFYSLRSLQKHWCRYILWCWSLGVRHTLIKSNIIICFITFKFSINYYILINFVHYLFHCLFQLNWIHENNWNNLRTVRDPVLWSGEGRFTVCDFFLIWTLPLVIIIYLLRKTPESIPSSCWQFPCIKCWQELYMSCLLLVLNQGLTSGWKISCVL